MNTKILICKCNDPSHNVIFHYDENDKDVYVSVHLVQFPWWKRLHRAFLYVLGKYVPFGNYEEILLKENDAQELQKIVDILKSNTEEKPVSEIEEN